MWSIGPSASTSDDDYKELYDVKQQLVSQIRESRGVHGR